MPAAPPSVAKILYRAGRGELAADGRQQVALQDPLDVGQAARRRRVPGTEHAAHQLVDQGVGLEVRTPAGSSRSPRPAASAPGARRSQRLEEPGRRCRRGAAAGPSAATGWPLPPRRRRTAPRREHRRPRLRRQPVGLTPPGVEHRTPRRPRGSDDRRTAARTCGAGQSVSHRGGSSPCAGAACRSVITPSPCRWRRACTPGRRRCRSRPAPSRPGTRGTSVEARVGTCA